MLMPPEPDPDAPPPADLSHAGMVIDRAIEYMIGEKIGSLAIASALLGGALGLLARTLSDEAIVRILDNALDSVQSGDLRKVAEPPADAHPRVSRRA